MSSPERPISPRYISPVRLQSDDETLVSGSQRERLERNSQPSPRRDSSPKRATPDGRDGRSLSRGRPDRYGRRSPDRRSPSPPNRSPARQLKRPGAPRPRGRSPSPPPRSPPRQLKRPGAAARARPERSVSPPARSPPRELRRLGASAWAGQERSVSPGSRSRARRGDRSASPAARSPPRELKRPGASGRARQERSVSPALRPQAHRRDRSASPVARSPPRALKRPRVSGAGPGATPIGLPAGAPRADGPVVRTDVSNHQLVTQHYNAVPQYGIKWRSESSNIRGLRSFNNWVKSCVINKFSRFNDHHGPLNVIDIGCGKGGDLQKWRSVRPNVRNYVGLDPAEVSIGNARERFEEMVHKNRGRPPFHATFGVKDCYGESIGNMEAVTRVGFDTTTDPRFSSAGFDIVTMMFCLHYAFETEAKARQMLANVSGCLRKGGRFFGVIPNSDVISANVSRGRKNWGNDLYQVEFRGDVPENGVFRPPYGWKYFYMLAEAVNDMPEYVVPFEAFRALAQDYNLELQYRRTFKEVWADERADPQLGKMAERMRVVDRSGRLMLTRQEEEAAFMYQAFCFYKV